MRNNWLFTAALMVGVSLATLGGMKGISDSQKTESKSSTKSLTTTASFRDGAYIGKRAADLGEKFHIAIGRWANESDRLNYAAGYESAYNLSQAAKSMPSGDLAAFRDGLYLGKLDADHGSGHHVAFGRWSKDESRVSFAEGYDRGYRTELLAKADRDATVGASLAR